MFDLNFASLLCYSFCFQSFLVCRFLFYDVYLRYLYLIVIFKILIYIICNYFFNQVEVISKLLLNVRVLVYFERG